MIQNKSIIKKISFFFVLNLLLIGLAACGTSGTSSASSDHDFDDWSEHMGEEKEDVFKELGLTEDKDIEGQFFEGLEDALYTYKNENETFHGDEFDKYLYFMPNNDMMSTSGYQIYYEDREDAYDMLRKLFDDFENDSELDRYDIQTHNTIGEWSDEVPDSFGKDGTGEFDQWAVDDEFDVKLEFMPTPDDEYRITIGYIYNEDSGPDEFKPTSS